MPPELSESTDRDCRSSNELLFDRFANDFRKRNFTRRRVYARECVCTQSDRPLSCLVARESVTLITEKIIRRITVCQSTCAVASDAISTFLIMLRDRLWLTRNYSILNNQFLIIRTSIYFQFDRNIHLRLIEIYYYYYLDRYPMLWNKMFSPRARYSSKLNLPQLNCLL